MYKNYDDSENGYLVADNSAGDNERRAGKQKTGTAWAMAPPDPAQKIAAKSV